MLARYPNELPKAWMTGEDAWGWSALRHACWHGHALVVLRLLKEGAEKDEADTFGQTPLYLASRYGNVETIKVLLSHGVDGNKGDSSDGRRCTRPPTSIPHRPTH